MQTASMQFGAGFVGPRHASTHFPRQHHYYYSQPHDPLQHTHIASQTFRPSHSPLATSHTVRHGAIDTYRPKGPPSPPSPPGDEVGKPSLPSISSLLHIAGSERIGSDTGSSRHSSPSQTHVDQAQQQPAATSHPCPALYERPDSLHHAHAQGPTSTSRVSLPPTPPMQPDALTDSIHSPPTGSSHSPFAGQGSYYLGQSLNNLDPLAQREAISLSAAPGNTIGASTYVSKRHSFPSDTTSSPYGPLAYNTSPYGSSPGGASVRSYYSADAASYSGGGMQSQRPLPSNFPPHPPSVQATLPAPGFGPSNAPASLSAMQSMYQQPEHYTHQHHHYISPSSASTFPQNQDRYICPTCNKAFSRPSSLRIHSHSHTGEKPFRCPHVGCGKAFSVRSNMKRHERGCHSATGADLQL